MVLADQSKDKYLRCDGHLVGDIDYLPMLEYCLQNSKGRHTLLSFLLFVAGGLGFGSLILLCYCGSSGHATKDREWTSGNSIASLELSGYSHLPCCTPTGYTVDEGSGCSFIIISATRLDITS